MKIAGNYTIDAPRDQVWEALNDIDVLARVVPGCQKLEMTGENEYEGTVKIGIQSIKGTYSGRIRLTDIQPPSHYTLVANGKSSNGIVDGTGTVDLEEQDGKTLLTYGGDAKISGTLASVGQRLIEGASKQLINQSLKALVEQIKQREGGAGTSANGAPAETPAAPSSAASDAPSAPAEAASDAPSAPAEIKSELDRRAAANAASAKKDATPSTETKPVDETPSQPPEPPQRPQPPAPPTFERRTVVVPESEQLKPEAVVSGMVKDFVNERPWIPWVAVAFLLGILIGRRGQ